MVRKDLEQWVIDEVQSCSISSRESSEVIEGFQLRIPAVPGVSFMAEQAWLEVEPIEVDQQDEVSLPATLWLRGGVAQLLHRGDGADPQRPRQLRSVPEFGDDVSENDDHQSVASSEDLAPSDSQSALRLKFRLRESRVLNCGSLTYADLSALPEYFSVLSTRAAYRENWACCLYHRSDRVQCRFCPAAQCVWLDGETISPPPPFVRSTAGSALGHLLATPTHSPPPLPPPLLPTAAGSPSPTADPRTTTNRGSGGGSAIACARRRLCPTPRGQPDRQFPRRV
ncbi:unnamed protein product, partial [Prorocentrum cordatum]